MDAAFLNGQKGGEHEVRPYSSLLGGGFRESKQLDIFSYLWYKFDESSGF
jgi:hypothetical protein